MSQMNLDSMAEDAVSSEGKPPSKPAIRVPKTAEVVANFIRKKIIRGELKEDDFLPHESQLLASLGVSRPTLREAFRILEAEMLITVGRGARTGARVHAPQVESVSRYAGFVLQSQKTTIADIYDARLAIEPFVARRLAERQPKGAPERLKAEVAKLEALVDERRYVDFMIGVAGFHRVMVELGGNGTLLLVTIILQDVVARYQVDFLKKRNLPQETQRERALWGLVSFNKMIEMIEAGDADRAESHWRLHLKNANKVWVETINPNQTIDTLD